MKSPHSSLQKIKSGHLGALMLGASLFAVASYQASGALTFDLRAISATGGASVANPKSVVNLAQGSVVTFEVWGQITAAANTAAFGFQSANFSVLSSNGGSILGNMGAFAPLAPWNNGSGPGAITASLDADSDLDVGSNATGSLSNYARARSDNTATGGGDPTAGFGNAQTTNVHVPAANFIPVTNAAGSGFEILLGTVTFTMTGLGAGAPGTPIAVNAKSSTTTLTGGTKATAAIFVENGVAKNGTSGVFALGQDVSLILIQVPEPSAFGMLILGAMGIVGLRRVGVRRA